MPMATTTAPITNHGIYVTCSFLSLAQVSRIVRDFESPAARPTDFTALFVEVLMTLTAPERPLAK